MKENAKINYLLKMDEIIAEKKKKGLVGINFCILPENRDAAENYQSMARAFCMVEDLRAKHFLKATSSNSL